LKKERLFCIEGPLSAVKIKSSAGRMTSGADSSWMPQDYKSSRAEGPSVPFLVL